MHNAIAQPSPGGTFAAIFTVYPHGTGGEILDLLILILLASAVLIVGTRTPQRAVTLLIVQACALTAIALLMATLSGNREIYISVAITITVKILIVPALLLRAERRAGSQGDSAMYLGARTATILAIGLILMAYVLVHSTNLAGARIDASYFPTSVALILVGGLIMIVRKKAVIQVIGLIVVENGTAVAAMATTNGLPVVIELGVSFDLFVTVLLLGSIAFRIGAATETLDTSTLRRLRG